MENKIEKKLKSKSAGVYEQSQIEQNPFNHALGTISMGVWK